MQESKIGNGCAIVIMVFIWPVGPLLATVFGAMRVNDAKAMFESFEETSGTILYGSTEAYEVTEDVDGTLETYVAGYQPKVRFEYEVDGEYFGTGEYAPKASVPVFGKRDEALAEVAMYETGEAYPVWYRNDQPKKAYLRVGDIGDYTVLRNVGIGFSS